MDTQGVSWAAVWLTLRLAAIVTLVLLVLGLPIAYWIAFSRARFRFLVEAVVALPLVLPPTVLGFYLLVALGTQSPIGRAYERLTGTTLVFHFAGLLIASVLYSLPFAVQPFASAFRSVNPQLLDAAATLGASRWRTFLQVLLPLSKGGIITGVVLSFAHTIGEFGVVLMVGGNIAGETRTVSIDVYDRVQELNYAAANQTSLLLLIFAFLVLAAVYGLNRSATFGVSR